MVAGMMADVDFPYGVMFHHFHTPGAPAAQGSITAEQLEQMIGFIGRDSILPAQEWYDKAVKGTLKAGELCFTLDDNLRCQYDIAVPVFEKFGITAFFFIYSAVSKGLLENLEIYRVFRTDYFDTLADFYAAFERFVTGHFPELKLAESLSGFRPADYLKPFPFYSDADRRFRYIRDELLKPERYNAAMDAMIAARTLDKFVMAKALWMDDAQLAALAAKGHMVGLHSFSHPTRLCQLPDAQQAEEYEKNYAHITEATGIAPLSMSHPCNSYSPQTLAMLEGMGIKLGFCSNMGEVAHRGKLEFAREDHANIMKRMGA